MSGARVLGATAGTAEIEDRAQRGIAPALEPMRIVGSSHQEGSRRRAGTAAEDGPQQIVQVGRGAPLAGLIGGAPQHIFECGGGVRRRMALDGTAGHLRGDGHRRLAPEGIDPDAESGQHVHCRADARQRMQQMLEPHILRDMEARDVVGAVAAGEHGVVDCYRAAVRARRRRRRPIGGPLRRDWGSSPGASDAWRLQVEVIAFVGHVRALPNPPAQELRHGRATAPHTVRPPLVAGNIGKLLSLQH